MREVPNSSQLGRSRVQAVAIVAIAALALAFATIGVPLGVATLDRYGPAGPAFIVIFPAIVVSLTLVGTFVALRVGNPVGWLMELSGLAAAAGIFGGTYVNYDHDLHAGLPLVVPIAWLSSWTLLPAIAMLLLYVPLLFPTGRFLGPRWRAFGLVALAGLAGAVTPALMPGPLSSAAWIDNPLGILGAADLLGTASTLSNLATPVFFGGAVASVFVRYRRAGIVERKQLKWFGLVAGLMVAAFLVSIPNDGPVSDIAWGLGLALMPLLPIAIGIAILRYRLWDIDRLVSRTLGWGIVTAVLVIVFGVAVIAFEDALSGITQGRTLAVAASTLAAAASFQLLRARVQAAVDRRFDRAHYDANRAIDEFAGRLRGELDLDTLAAELGRVADTTVRPETASVWLRTATNQRSQPGS